MTRDDQVRRLLASYDDAVNRRDAKQWGDNWVEDAVWVLWDGERTGREKIVADWVALMGTFKFVDFRTRIGDLTYNSNNAATARCYTTDLLVHGDEHVEQVCGVYFDNYQSDGERWRFARREYHILYRATLSVTDVEYADTFPTPAG